MKFGVCVFDRGRAIADWLERELEDAGGARCDLAIGVVHRGRIAGAIGFVDWSEEHGNVTILAVFRRGAQVRDAVNEAHRHAFQTLGAVRVNAVVLASNEQGRRFAEWWGYAREGTLRRAWRRTEDLLVYRMTPRMWRRSKARTHRDYTPVQVSYMVTDGEIEVIPWAA